MNCEIIRVCYLCTMKRLVSPTKSVQEKVRQLVHNVYGYASLYTYDRQNADSYDLSIEGSIQSHY